jgi:hypothetical protein
MLSRPHREEAYHRTCQRVLSRSDDPVTGTGPHREEAYWQTFPNGGAEHTDEVAASLQYLRSFW